MKKIQFNVAKKIALLLKQKDYILCSAESCTGGGIAKALTDVPGCSKFFAGGVVAYSNMIKIRLLYISEETLEIFGAVSEKTAIEMVNGASNIFDTDFCIASTGIAGPSGGTIQKPVGTVWLAVATPKNVMTLECHFTGNRESIREQAITHGLKFLKEEIQNYIDR